MPLVSDRSDDSEDALDDRKAVSHWTGFNPLKAECLEGQSTLADPQCGAIVYAPA
jgi:hypothetical protein